MYETDRAIDHLQTVIRIRPAAPAGAAGLAQLLLGEAHDRLGRRDLAVAAYTAALAAVPSNDPSDVRDRARAGLRRSPDATGAEAYRLSLEGLRALEGGHVERGAAAFARAATLHPDDPVIADRHARTLVAIGDIAGARVKFERVLRAQDGVPATVLASACVDYAALLERSDERSRALALYQRAVGIVGGEARAREEAQAAIKRLLF